MKPSAQRPSGASRLAKLALAGLCGLGLLGLQACVSPSSLPEPKYPIYMRDKPAEATQTPAQAGDGIPTPAPIDDKPAVTGLGNSGVIATAELAPPPPPPPPAEVAPTPAKASLPAPPAVTAPVRETGAAYVYVLESHDTLYGVSRRFGVPVSVLYDINALPKDASLRIGQKILLPATAVDKGVEDHANGAGMTRLVGGTQAVKPAPAAVATKPAAPAPAPVVAVAKPPVAAPAKPEPTKPDVAKPAPAPTAIAVSKPAVSVPAPAVTMPAKPPVTVPAAPAPKPQPLVQPKPATPAGFPSSNQISQMGRGIFTWPLHGKIIVPFGQLAPNVRNDGINIAADKGADIVASADGVVVYEGDQVKELGNTIYVKHDGGWYTGYSHLGEMKVKNNERVRKGQVIATVGQTGVIDRPQLHFEIRYTPSTDIARPIDPNLVLP